MKYKIIAIFSCDLIPEFENVLADVSKRIKNIHNISKVFISYAWGKLLYERWINRFYEYLKKAGLKVILVGSPKFRKKMIAERKHHIVKDEIGKISKKFEQNPSAILPILIAGDDKRAFPKFITVGKDKISYSDFRTFIRLLNNLYKS